MSNLTQSSEPGCNNAPGDIIELRRLPGVRLEVVAVWKRESFGDREIYMLELAHVYGDTLEECRARKKAVCELLQKELKKGAS